MKSNLEKITQARVEAEVQLRRKEIEEQVADTNEKLQRLNVDVGQLQQE